MNDISDPQIDALLRRHFPGTVPDDGFSARVMHALPPRRRSHPWLLPAAALGGGLVAWLSLLPSPLWQQLAQEWLAAGPGASTATVGALLLGVTLLGCGWALDET